MMNHTNNAELLAQYRASQCPRIKAQLVRANAGLVFREANLKAHGDTDLIEDLVQEGYVGLVKAIARFDTTTGYKFSCFAVPYIRGAIQHYLRDKLYPVRIPRPLQLIQCQAAKALSELEQKLGRKPTGAEVAEHMGISLEKWQEIKDSFINRKAHALSLDQPILADDEFSTIGETLCTSPQTQDEDHEWIREELISFLPQTSDRTAQVIGALYLQGKAVKDACELLGVSEMTVRRHRERGIKAFREYLLCDN
jgi:RNA polymerase sigma-B factor